MHPQTYRHTHTRWMFAGGVGVIKYGSIKQQFLTLIFSSDLLRRSLDASSVLWCLPAPLVTFLKLYIQNEIPSLQESSF